MTSRDPNPPESTERQTRFEPTSQEWDVQEGSKTFGGGPPKPGMSQPMLIGVVVVLVVVVLLLAFVVF